MPLLAFLFLAVLQQPVIPSTPSLAADALKDAVAKYERNDRAAALLALDHAITLAVEQQDRATEAEARYYLGTADLRSAQYDAAKPQLETALALFVDLGNKPREASSHSQLGSVEYFHSKNAEARAHFERALAIYESLGAWSLVANQHRNLLFVTSGAEQRAHRELGIEIARKAGAKLIEARLLHSWADEEYAVDNFDGAFDKLKQAEAIFRELHEIDNLARVLTSLGRLYRVHGHPEEAFGYYQTARALEQEAGDVQGEIQTLNAIGVSLDNMGRYADALKYNELGLKKARDAGAAVLVKVQMEAVAGCHNHLGHFREAIAILEESRRSPPVRIEAMIPLAEAHYQLAEFSAALLAIEDGLATVQSKGELYRAALLKRARILEKLGRTQEALHDVRELTGLVDQARENLVATDFMKQGFATTDRDVTSFSIQILLDNGEAREALEAAERARSRAFLDLLATKNVIAGAHASAASAADAIALAQRLKSTILAYWVDDAATVIWAVSPDGAIKSARTNNGAATLDKWIDEALRPIDRRGTPVASRGDGVLTMGDGRVAWRHLYDALIRPVRSSLPPGSGRLLTIIPNGPLFRLSFAALLDERGQYLIEKFALHYSPAIEVFPFAAAAKEKVRDLPETYLLVANPDAMPSSAARPLPALPGAENEIEGISRMLPAGSSTTLQRDRATEARVREQLGSARVIHLATHGVVDYRNPLNSYLAFGRTGDGAAVNGMLTAEEVYSLELHADLVVLSACRSGTGRVSGDGVAGLARAFFYAGAASVISTLWDVADQPTAPLIRDFYRGFAQSGVRKSDALRRAQINLLHSLRTGQMKVDTPFGKLVLPESPSLWAGFVLMGEP